jgi:hypothetical protein
MNFASLGILVTCAERRSGEALHALKLAIVNPTKATGAGPAWS